MQNFKPLVLVTFYICRGGGGVVADLVENPEDRVMQPSSFNHNNMPMLRIQGFLQL